MHESNELALRTMLESIEKIERFSLNIRFWQDLKNDEKTFDACLMNFVIIGESVLQQLNSQPYQYPSISTSKFTWDYESNFCL